MKPIALAYSQDPFDQWRLSQVGGRIGFRRNTPIFLFDSQSQYEQFLSLNAKRTQSA